MTQPQLGAIGRPQARTGPMPTSGRYGWYRDHEGNEYRRVSTLIKQVETDKHNLDLWKLRQVAEGLAIRDDLVLSIKAMGRPNVGIGWTAEDKKKINGLVEDAMAAAKQRDGGRAGTAYHDLTERLDRGEPLESVIRALPPGTAQMIRAYEYLRRENGWRSVEIERTVVCDELEVAGTFDRIDLVPGLAALLGPGECQYGHSGNHAGTVAAGDELPVVVDVKSESAPWLNGLHIGPQLAIYSRAQRMWRPLDGVVPLLGADGSPKLFPSGDPITTSAGEYVPAPCVRQDVAIVVHVTETAANPLFINLSEGWEAAQAAYAQANRVARAKRRMGADGAWFAEVPGIKRPPVPSPAQLAANRGGQRCLTCQKDVAPDGSCKGCAAVVLPATPAAPVVQESYRRDDGMVDWRPAAEVPVGATVTVAGVGFTKVDTVTNVVEQGALDDVDKQAIESIWAATDVPGLARIFAIYTETIGRTWGGRVAEAGAGRQAQVECPQRALHTGGPGAKCACGWDSRFPA